MAMPAPTTPIGACLGNGVVIVKFVPPGAAVKRYEIAASRTETGVYSLYNNCRFATRVGYLFGFPMIGANLFLRIRAVGTTNEASNWVQVARGHLLKPTATFKCKCISGSIIPANSVFATMHPAGRLMAVKAVSDVEFT